MLQSLTRAGLVISHRGNTGGFELSAASRDASLLNVVEAIEGPMPFNICLSSELACTRQEWCPAHGVWAEAQEAMLGVLQNVSIDSLAAKLAAENGGPHIDAR